MKRGLVGILVSVVALFFFSSILFAQGLTSVVEANNQFAFDLYAQYKLKDGNIFFSPYSISTALAMVYEGARGKTAEEIQTVFHFPKDASVLRQSCLKIYQQINKQNKRYKLSTANALWAQKDYKFLQDYFNLIEQYYGGKVTNLDFIDEKEREKSRIIINNWVAGQTNDKIKDLIPPGLLDELTRLVLTNAIYFKGLWYEQFEERNTKDQDFRVNPGNTIKVKMMSLTGKHFNYAQTENLQILEMPYAGKELSMLVLLPKNDDLKLVEDSLGAKKLSELKDSLIRERVNIYIPKFKFETKYFMADDLKEMGMPTAFTPGIDFGGEADFSGMTGNRDLNIDQVIHQAFVEVNEEGTEAAAATAVVMKTRGLPEPPKIFRADHPFIFVIQDRETGNVLFMGRVSDPTK